MGSPAGAPSLRSLSCPNCGAPLQVRGLGRSQSVVCAQCLAVLDINNQLLQVVQRFNEKQRYQPLIPLGSRGTLRGELYEAIGFQVRQMTVDGASYSWSEYVLFNPYRGFRYLTEYNGHWNDTIPAHALPVVKGGAHATANFLNEKFKHFQTYTATTTFVLGEFPWRVRVGEQATCNDYVHPPRMLSSEVSDGEVVWSVGEYTPGDVIWKAFQLKGSPPPVKGVFSNQPSPHKGRVGRVWKGFVFWVAVLVLIQIAFGSFHSNSFVFSRRYRFAQQPGTAVENSFVTEVFDLKGRTSNVQVSVATNLSNDWSFFNLALINADTGHAIDFSREISYYYGRDSDGDWIEGRSKETVVLPSVPSGRYYLRVEPEPDPNRPVPQTIDYQIQIRRDVTTWEFFVMAVILLAAPPIFVSFRSVMFESKRWSESDYAGGD